MPRCFLARFFLSLAVLSSACAESGADFFPLEQGRRWENELNLLGPSGQTVSGRMVSIVEGTEVINGREYWKVVQVTSGIPGAEPAVMFFRSDSGGVYYIPGAHRDAPEQLTLPSEVAVGTSWTTQTPQDSGRHRIEAREDAHVFDRTYENCIKVVSEGTTVMVGEEFIFESVAYYAAGIGAVSGDVKFRGAAESREVTISYALIDAE